MLADRFQPRERLAHALHDAADTAGTVDHWRPTRQHVG
jgi:hypothetical protein